MKLEDLKATWPMTGYRIAPVPGGNVIFIVEFIRSEEQIDPDAAAFGLNADECRKFAWMLLQAADNADDAAAPQVTVN